MGFYGFFAAGPFPVRAGLAVPSSTECIKYDGLAVVPMFNALASSNVLFLAGAALMALSAAGMAVAAVVLRISGQRLRAKLEEEFGKKRR